MIQWGNVKRHFQNIECPMSGWILSGKMPEYPYQFDIKLDYVKDTGTAFVVFGEDEINTTDYAPICETIDGAVRIFSKNVPFKNIIIPVIEYVE